MSWIFLFTSLVTLHTSGFPCLVRACNELYMGKHFDIDLQVKVYVNVHVLVSLISWRFAFLQSVCLYLDINEATAKYIQQCNVWNFLS